MIYPLGATSALFVLVLDVFSPDISITTVPSPEIHCIAKHGDPPDLSKFTRRFAVYLFHQATSHSTLTLANEATHVPPEIQKFNFSPSRVASPQAVILSPTSLPSSYVKLTVQNPKLLVIADRTSQRGHSLISNNQYIEEPASSLQCSDRA
ncbi:hypothetical protein B0A52_09898 [Exophiala mesophila]|uniref:Uncharacterized protein n=1 Tax=Exophiala mesophila TaxID=212818 RepID=A0A438MRD0_EXOME|nr:hypothetical protein B0A52_09898 [Exophiala mesophila]